MFIGYRRILRRGYKLLVAKFDVYSLFSRIVTQSLTPIPNSFSFKLPISSTVS